MNKFVTYYGKPKIPREKTINTLITMNRTTFKVPVGGMYQERMSLMDLVEKKTSEKLNDIADKEGWRKYSLRKHGTWALRSWFTAPGQKPMFWCWWATTI